jgi:hypothetical protein
VSALLGLLFGLLQGLRHAFEPDHVVAVTTMISDQRTTRARVGYAAAWGLGHATMLLVVGGFLMVLRAQLPPRVDAMFELAVAIMLVGLGCRALRGAFRAARQRDAEPHARPHEVVPGWRSVGPLAMGMVHGLAGSGALTALVVARLPSPGAGIVFIVLFGAGATLGMSLFAGVAGVPFARVLRRPGGLRALLGATGGLSLVTGLVWLMPAALRLAAS